MYADKTIFGHKQLQYKIPQYHTKRAHIQYWLICCCVSVSMGIDKGEKEKERENNTNVRLYSEQICNIGPLWFHVHTAQ